ncbi:MAG: DUF503 domain-containing protein [Chloroflexi bacterium]|nr:DUF503 domain-containing protein [Chloroflexota bacterium]
MVVGTSIIQLHLPGIKSLKEKRSVLKGLINRLHKEFNIACAEVEFHDVWQSSGIGIAVISTSTKHAKAVIDNVVNWIELNRPDLSVIDYSMEILHITGRY